MDQSLTTFSSGLRLYKSALNIFLVVLANSGLATEFVKNFVPVNKPNAETTKFPTDCRERPNGRIVKVFYQPKEVKLIPTKYFDEWYTDDFHNCWIHVSQVKWKNQ